MHYYQFNIADYRKDTQHLTPTEHYVYRQLIDYCYLNECAVVITTVTRLLSLRSTEEQQALQNVIKDFFYETEEGFKNKRIEYEIEKYHKQKQSSSRAGKKSAQKRWCQGANNTNTSITTVTNRYNENVTDVQRLCNQPLTINQEPLTINQLKELTHIAKASAKKNNEVIRPTDVNNQIWTDWLKIRKAKRLPLTITAFDLIKNKIFKAGYSLNDGLKICCEKGWAGFENSWIEKDKPKIHGGCSPPEAFRAEVIAHGGNNVFTGKDF